MGSSPHLRGAVPAEAQTDYSAPTLAPSKALTWPAPTYTSSGPAGVHKGTGPEFLSHEISMTQGNSRISESFQ